MTSLSDGEPASRHPCASLGPRCARTTIGRGADALEDPYNDLYVSSISVAEIEIKRKLGKLSLSHSCQTLVVRLGAQWLDLTASHAMGLRSLPQLHADPFDRLLIAQALAEELTLVTGHRKVLAYPVSTVVA